MTMPEHDPVNDSSIESEDRSPHAESEHSGDTRNFAPQIEDPFAFHAQEFERPAEFTHQLASPLFQSWEREPIPTKPRIPHMGHVALLGTLAALGLLGSSLLVHAGLHFKLFGISSPEKAATDVHYTVASMGALYFVTFGIALIVYPLLWQRSFFAGVHWNTENARSRLRLLLGSACICFVLAMVDEVLLPGPANAPIDKLFESRAAAWLLFAFGVTVAPFFEELVFRGFLLPAICTAIDWCGEKLNHTTSLPLDDEGNPQWTLRAMVAASVLTSVPFALMHAEQTAWSLGPFLLLFTVSMILSWARLSTRSLAASTLVHASYNFLLFSLMVLGTQGFRHMERM